MITEVVNSISSAFTGLRNATLFILKNNVETYKDKLLAMLTIQENHILPVNGCIAVPKELDATLNDYMERGIYEKSETVYYYEFINHIIECLDHDLIDKELLPKEWQKLSIAEIHVELVNLLYSYMLDKNCCGFKIDW